MNVNFIINQFGGITAATKIFGVKYPSVIQGWIKRNKIPDWRIELVREKAQELGISLDEPATSHN